MCNGWCSLDPSKILSLLDYWDCPAMMSLDVVPVGMIVQVVKTMDNILLTWIGNAVYYALKLVTQSLLRDVTMIYGTKLRKLC